MTIPKGENIGLGLEKCGKIMKNAKNIHTAKMRQLEQKTYAEFEHDSADSAKAAVQGWNQAQRLIQISLSPQIRGKIKFLFVNQS